MTAGIRKLLESNGSVISTQNIEETAVADGMLTMLQNGALKVISGETTLEEVLRVVG